jgi:hypothetical protein
MEMKTWWAYPDEQAFTNIFSRFAAQPTSGVFLWNSTSAVSTMLKQASSLVLQRIHRTHQNFLIALNSYGVNYITFKPHGAHALMAAR